MNSKYLVFGISAFIIVILLLITDCFERNISLQKEKTFDNLNETNPNLDQNTPKWNISEPLKFCLQKYVYGKEEDWVDLAKNHCEQLLPDHWYCRFGNSKGGTFGILCPGLKSDPELHECLKNITFCPDCGDSEYIEQANIHCYTYLDRDCSFGAMGVDCLID